MSSFVVVVFFSSRASSAFSLVHLCSFPSSSAKSDRPSIIFFSPTSCPGSCLLRSMRVLSLSLSLSLLNERDTSLAGHLSRSRSRLQKKKTTRFCRRPGSSSNRRRRPSSSSSSASSSSFFEKKSLSLSLSVCGVFVRSRWCVPETRKKMDALQRCVPRGRFFYLGFYLGFRKRAKKRKKGEGVSWTRLPDDVPTRETTTTKTTEKKKKKREKKRRTTFQRRRRHARSFVLCELLWCFEKGRDAVTPPTTKCDDSEDETS